MIDKLETTANGVSSIAIIIGSLILGTMMTFVVGPMLLRAGRPEAIVPLGLGLLALYRGGRESYYVYKDVKRAYLKR